MEMVNVAWDLLLFDFFLISPYLWENHLYDLALAWVVYISQYGSLEC